MKIKNIAKVFLSLCIMFTGFIFVGCDNNTLKEINLVDGTIVTSIRQGDTLDLSNAEIELTYSKGNKEIVSFADLEFSSIDTSVVGEQTLTITYKGKTVNVVVNVYKYVSEVSVKEGTVNLTVLQNHTLDTSNIVFVEKYSDDSTVEISADELTIGAFSTENVGTFPLEVTYNGRTASVDITVEKYITSVSLDLNNKVVEQNEQLNLEGLVFIEKYSDNSEERISTGLTITQNIDTTVLGTHTLKVKYNNRIAELEITVIEHTESIYVKENTVSNKVYQFNSYDLSNLVVVVVSSNGREEELSYSTHRTEITLGEIDTTIVEGDSQQKSFKVTFQLAGSDEKFETTVNYTVFAVESVEFDSTTLLSSVLQYEVYDYSNIKFIVNYTDGTSKQTEEAYLTNSIDTNTSGVKTLIGAYPNKDLEIHFDVTVYELESISIVSGCKDYYLNHTSYDASNIVAQLNYANGETKLVSNNSANTSYNPNLIVNNNVEFDNTLVLKYNDVELEKPITVINIQSIEYTGDDFSGYQYREPNTENVKLQVLATYENGETYTFNNNNGLYVEFYGIDNQSGVADVKLLLDDYYMAHYNYNNIPLDHITANLDEVLPQRTTTGELIDRTDLVVTAYWQEDNGYVYSEVVYSSEVQDDIYVNFIFNETTVGVQDYTISYYGKTVSQEIEVTENDYSITGFEQPSFVTAYQTNSVKQNTYLTTGSNGQPGFTETNNTYVVGTDNAFIFEPILKVMNLELETTQQLKSFNKDIAVYVLVDSEYQKLDMEEVENVLHFSKDNIEYLTVEEQTKYYFTSNASNNMFKLEVYPASLTEDEKEKVDAISFEFKVTEGYNVYNVADFSVLDNTNAKLTEETHNGIMVNKSNYSSNGKWTTLKEQNGIDSSIKTSKIILHSNIKITLNDIPSIHYYEQGGSNYLVDSKDFITGSIYTRYLAKNETFTLEGNYFTIDTSSLPRIIREDGNTSDNDSDKPATTHTAFLRIFSDNAEAGTFNMNNVEIFGNSPKTDNSTEWGGIMFAKFYHINSNVNNCLSQRWFISFLYDGDESIADNCVNNIKNTNCFDANNSLLYIFGARLVYIEDSIMIGAGGPVMIVDHVKNEDANGGYVSNVKVKNSTLESWVSGEESWFVGFNATQVASQIKALNELTSSPYLNKNFLKVIKDENDNEVSLMNIIAVYKSSSAEGFTASKIYSTFEDVSTDENENRIHDYVMHAETYYGDYKTHLCTTNGGNVIINNDNTPDNSSIGASAQAFQTSEDYLILHYLNGMCIILGFNE